jgi:hypothetical protein
MPTKSESAIELAPATHLQQHWAWLTLATYNKIEEIVKAKEVKSLDSKSSKTFWDSKVNTIFTDHEVFGGWELPLRAVITDSYKLGPASRYALLCFTAASIERASSSTGTVSKIIASLVGVKQNQIDQRLQWGRTSSFRWEQFEKYPYVKELLNFISEKRSNGRKNPPTLDEYRHVIGCTDTAPQDFIYWLRKGEFKLGHEVSALDMSIKFVIGITDNNVTTPSSVLQTDADRAMLLRTTTESRRAHFDKPILCLTSQASSVGLSAFATSLYFEVQKERIQQARLWQPEIRFCYLLLPAKQMIGPKQRTTAPCALRFVNDYILLSQLKAFFLGKSVYDAEPLQSAVDFDNALQFVRTEYSRQRCIIVFDGFEVNNGPLASIEDTIAGTGILGLLHALAVPIEPVFGDSTFKCYFADNRIVLLSDKQPAELFDVSTHKECPPINIGAHRKTVEMRFYAHGTEMLDATNHTILKPPGDIRYSLADFIWKHDSGLGEKLLDVKRKTSEVCELFTDWFAEIHQKYLPILQLIALKPFGIDVVELKAAYGYYLLIESVAIDDSKSAAFDFRIEEKIKVRAAFEVEDFIEQFSEFTVLATVSKAERYLGPSAAYAGGRLFLFCGPLAEAVVASTFKNDNVFKGNERFCLMHRLLCEQAAIRLTENRRLSKSTGVERKVDLRHCCEVLYHGCLSLANTERSFWAKVFKGFEGLGGISNLLIPEEPIDALAWFDGVIFREHIDAYPRHELSRYFGKDQLKLELLLLMCNPGVFACLYEKQLSKGPRVKVNARAIIQQNRALYKQALDERQIRGGNLYSGKSNAENDPTTPWTFEAFKANLRSVAHAAREVGAPLLGRHALLVLSEFTESVNPAQLIQPSESIGLSIAELEDFALKDSTSLGAMGFLTEMGRLFPEFGCFKLIAPYYENTAAQGESFLQALNLREHYIGALAKQWFGNLDKHADTRIGCLVDPRRVDLVVTALNHLGVVTLNQAERLRTFPDFADSATQDSNYYLLSMEILLLSEKIRLENFYAHPLEYRMYQPSGGGFRGAVRASLQIVSLLHDQGDEKSLKMANSMLRLAIDNLNIYTRHHAKYPPDRCHILILQSSIFRSQYNLNNQEVLLIKARNTLQLAERLLLTLEVGHALWRRFLLERLRVSRQIVKRASPKFDSLLRNEYISLMESDSKHLTELADHQPSIDNSVTEDQLWANVARRQAGHIFDLKQQPE